jgi:ubiquinone/menaquinone biosynthesis C-methylase UbiE
MVKNQNELSGLDLKEWEDLSDWYDKKQGDTGDLWHRTLIDPVLLRLVGDPHGMTILDLGSGNGYLSRRLAGQGGKVTAVDSSPRMMENAKSHDPDNSLGIAYLRDDSSTLTSLTDESFDLVFANMSLMDIEDAEGAVKTVSRLLRKGGRFVASISHPCFDNGSNSGWLIERVMFETKTYRRIRAYRKPFSEAIPWRLPNGEKRYTLAFHRPLSWYARVLYGAGLAITALEEPEPTEEFSANERDVAGFIEVPLHLVLEAIKL